MSTEQGKPPRKPPEAVNWDSPRWRESDQGQGEMERARRFRGDQAPRQRGVIDQDGSVSGSAGAPPREPPPGDDERSTPAQR
jgi:hypothetical protein